MSLIRYWVTALLVLARACTTTGARAASEHPGLERPASHEALLRDSARDHVVVVALFSLPGCPFCEAIRRDQLRPLAREQASRQLRVVEYDLTDRTPFGPSGTIPAAPQSPAALAAALDIRLAPTVVFLAPDGSELAERLIGYPSPDFYGAYLEQRLEQAHARLGAH